jgi:glycosyltransferase involved in cell wall biosynthesis
MEPLKLLIVNGDLPTFPGRAGHEYLHTTRLSQLADKVGLVSLVHTHEQHEQKSGLADAGVALYLWEHPQLDKSIAGEATQPTWLHRVGKAVYTFARTYLRRPWDTFLQDLQFSNISGPLLHAFCDGSWQAVVVVQSQCAHWLDYLPRVPVSVLVLHDVRTLVYERRAQAAGSLGERLACLLAARLYRRFERKYCYRYDLVVTVSPADEAWVRSHYHPLRQVTIPIPVDSDYFAPMPSVREAAASIVFTGMMNHPPNVDAACFFARQVLPRVRAAIPEADFWIVGRDPLATVRALGNLPGVVVSGFVPDIRPYIAQATVVVVPLRFGSGMRNKILEAWAMEKCVVSTRIGAEGLDYQDGVNILIADDAQAMAEQTIQAIRDPILRDQVRGKGRDLVASQHHPERLSRQYYQAISSVVREKGQCVDPMRVVIDLQWMRPGVAGGIENLSRSFVKHLLDLDGFNRYKVLIPAEARYDFDLRDHANFTISTTDGPGHDWQHLFWYATRSLHSRLKLHYWRSPEVETLRRVRTFDAELGLSIPGYIHPDLYPLANVLIVPDIQHEYCPEFFSPEELHERRRLYTDSIKRAAYLCAISEFTRQTLIERLGVAPERVTTTYLAADPLFHPESACRGRPQQVLARYGLTPSEYLLFPGHTWPHKNHRAGLQALRILRDTYHLTPLLVCTGTPKAAHGGLRQTISDLHLEDQVRFLGYCPTPHMPALYEGAAALIFPSFFEGFGLPLLEAMWCDCPVVCGNTTSLPEIAGDAALLIDPHSPEALAEAIYSVLTDGALRRMLIERGRRRVREFSWLKFTVQILRTLQVVREMRCR